MEKQGIATIEFDYDPGNFVFDYYNEQQLAEVARSLGINVTLSQDYSRETSSKVDGKASIKIFEVSGESSTGSSITATTAGTPYTAILLQCLGILNERASVESRTLAGSWEGVHPALSKGG